MVMLRVLFGICGVLFLVVLSVVLSPLVLFVSVVVPVPPVVPPLPPVLPVPVVLPPPEPVVVPPDVLPLPPAASAEIRELLLVNAFSPWPPQPARKAIGNRKAN